MTDLYGVAMVAVIALVIGICLIATPLIVALFAALA